MMAWCQVVKKARGQDLTPRDNGRSMPRRARLPSPQLPLPFLAAPPASRGGMRPLLVTGALTIWYTRHRRARRYLLRVRPDGSVVVTLPPFGSKAEARDFVEANLAWVARQRILHRRVERPRTLLAGGTVLLRGALVELRRVDLARHAVITFGDQALTVPRDVVELRDAVDSHLKALARETLPARVLWLAAGLGLTVRAVSIRNQRTRWGSCSASGRIALNWRLVQMPPDVADYVVIHELMHLIELSHSKRFWKLVAAACPTFREHRRWLVREGRTLLPH